MTERHQAHNAPKGAEGAHQPDILQPQKAPPGALGALQPYLPSPGRAEGKRSKAHLHQLHQAPPSAPVRLPPPASREPRTLPGASAACALATGTTRYDHCIACGTPVLQSRNGLACTTGTCVIYGRQEAA
jgi:hypothetical protein